MDQEELYDEFGNYIGPDLEQVEGESELIVEDDQDDLQPRDEIISLDTEETPNVSILTSEPYSRKNQIILHEDKKYYPSAEEVYGPDVETLVQSEDTQALETPIIKPIIKKSFELREESIPETLYSKEYLVQMLDHQENCRNVVLMGNIHCGKTVIVDMFLKQTHPQFSNIYEEIRYCDQRIDEQKRAVSVKSCPMTFLLPNSQGKNFLINVIDTPGHSNFSDEVSASARLCDGAIIVIDAIEGVTIQTERFIKMAAQERLGIVLIINKMDRLILEVKLPPDDAYLKLKHMIGEINVLIEGSYGPENAPIVSPEMGNVCFASAVDGWSFTIPSFAKLYSDWYKNIDPSVFAKKLWGESYFDEETRKFTKLRPKERPKRSFVHFVLEPIYKLYSHVVGQDVDELQVFLKKVGVKLAKNELKYDIKPLIKVVMGRFFKECFGLIDMVSQSLPSPAKAAKSKVQLIYTGPLDTKEAEALINCDSRGPLLVYITKLYPKSDGSSFDAFGRVMSGTLKSGEEIRILGEGFTKNDQEDSITRKITRLSIAESRYQVDLNQAPAGSLVLIEGIDSIILKTATIVSTNANSPYIFRPLSFNTISIMKLSVEPLNPSELPKMIEGLRKLNKSYPLLTTKVEESGEHVIIGTGELYLDCVMHDLRQMFSEIEIKVSDPVVSFCETIFETSTIKTYAETPNKHNKITMIAEPLEKGLAEDIENGDISLNFPKKKMAEFFKKYKWDTLQSHSIWSFGPDDNGPNILLNETLPMEIDPKLLNTVKDSIVRGFKWGSREGPLCDEPMRNVKFRILDATISDDPLYRGSGQVIPTARRVCYSSFLMSTPKMMEPIYYTEIQTPLDSIKAVYNVLDRRRGHVTHDLPIPGSPLYTIKAYVPCIDSFGLETDIRAYTQGQAFCLSMFHHWAIAPGDPLDKSIILRPLEPSPPQYLAREFMIKTRRRKGLGEDVSITKYFDDPMLHDLTRQDIRDQVSQQLLQYT